MFSLCHFPPAQWLSHFFTFHIASASVFTTRPLNGNTPQSRADAAAIAAKLRAIARMSYAVWFRGGDDDHGDCLDDDDDGGDVEDEGDSSADGDFSDSVDGMDAEDESELNCHIDVSGESGGRIPKAPASVLRRSDAPMNLLLLRVRDSCFISRFVALLYPCTLSQRSLFLLTIIS